MMPERSRTARLLAGVSGVLAFFLVVALAVLLVDRMQPRENPSPPVSVEALLSVLEEDLGTLAEGTREHVSLEYLIGHVRETGLYRDVDPSLDINTSGHLFHAFFICSESSGPSLGKAWIRLLDAAGCELSESQEASVVRLICTNLKDRPGTDDAVVFPGDRVHYSTYRCAEFLEKLEGILGPAGYRRLEPLLEEMRLQESRRIVREN